MAARPLSISGGVMSEADPRLSELRRTMLDAGMDLVWEVHLPALPEGESTNDTL
ncbi:MAG: hypothetical protein ABR585_07875 [Gemmatimonadaceae bacterium]